MRITLLFILIVNLTACTKAKDKAYADFIPLEYQLPKENNPTGKIIHYYIIGGSRHEMRTVIRPFIKNGKTLNAEINYTDDFKTDSVITNTKGNLLEMYNCNLLKGFEWKPVKAEIIERRILDDGSKFGKRILKTAYKTKERQIEINETEQFLYDTILQENGLPLKCLVTRTKTTTLYKKQDEEIAKETVTKKSYYAKNCGLLYYSIDTKDNNTLWYISYISKLQ
jgi:hypothetical protein